MPIDDFCRLNALQQLATIAEHADWLTERSGEECSCLYCMLADFYVEVRFIYRDTPGIRITAFTGQDPVFDQLLDALPVDPGTLLRPAA